MMINCPEDKQKHIFKSDAKTFENKVFINLISQESDENINEETS